MVATSTSDNNTNIYLFFKVYQQFELMVITYTFRVLQVLKVSSEYLLTAS